MSIFRYRLFAVFILIAFGIIFGRLFQLQVINGGKLTKAARKHQQKIKALVFRGDILDRFGKALAIDVSKYTVEYNPIKNNESREKLANELSGIISFNRDKLYKNSSQVLARNVSQAEAQKIRALKSDLLYLRKNTARFYPQKQLASQVLGYVDLYGKARKGVEAKFEEYLSNRNDLTLSIDSRLQAFTEKALANTIEKTKAKRGTVLVMDSKTGELISWATKPNYDPNNYFNYQIENIKNWAAVDVYQPGSIFKIITVASALESETIPPDYEFFDHGYIKVDRWKISNHDFVSNKKYEPESLDLPGLFARSSNPFAAHIGLKMGPNTFYKYIKAFGIGSKTGIELIGESNGILKKAKKWRESDTASTAIGQGAFSLTPLQLLSAVNVIANDGVWIRPSLIKNNKKNDAKRIISQNTSKTIRGFLEEAIEYNLKEKHARAGRVEGLRIAGKTGTAQKPRPGGGYYPRKTIASFTGIFDVKGKTYTVLAIVDDPQTDGRWGDTVAGPLFNKVAKSIKNLY